MRKLNWIEMPGDTTVKDLIRTTFPKGLPTGLVMQVMYKAIAWDQSQSKWNPNVIHHAVWMVGQVDGDCHSGNDYDDSDAFVLAYSTDLVLDTEEFK